MIESDPNIVQRLQAEIASLQTQLREEKAENPQDLELIDALEKQVDEKKEELLEHL